MNILTKRERERVQFLMDFDYGNVLGRLIFVLGNDASLFANISIGPDEVTWFTDDDYDYKSYSEATEKERQYLHDLVEKKIAVISNKISNDSVIGFIAEKITSYPSDQCVFYRNVDGRYHIVLAGWGCGIRELCCTSKNELKADNKKGPRDKIGAGISEEERDERQGEKTEDSNRNEEWHKSDDKGLRHNIHLEKDKISLFSKPHTKNVSRLFMRYGIVAVCGIAVCVLTFLVVLFSSSANQHKVNQHKEAALLQIHTLIRQASTEEKKGRNYDSDYHEWHFMDAYLLYEEAHSIAQQEKLDQCVDTIESERRHVVRELRTALTRIQGQYAEAVDYNLSDSTLYRSRVDSLKIFLRENNIIYGEKDKP